MISGANRGIGRAITEKLLAEGYRLSLGVRSPKKLPEALRSEGKEQVLVHAYDARDGNSAKAWVHATAGHFGQIDGLVNNAGILHTVGLEDDQDELLDEMWEVNAKAPLRLTRLAFPYLRQSGSGRVIEIISMSGKRVKGNWVGYSMSKYAALAASRHCRNGQFVAEACQRVRRSGSDDELRNGTLLNHEVGYGSETGPV